MAADSETLTVYYDGACPLCRREIGFYQGRCGADEVCWVDVSCCTDEEVAPGLSKTAALARFHVQAPDGSLSSGGLAFAKLWTALPGFRAVGRIAQLPPLVWVLERGYRSFLKVRPRLQAMLAKNERIEPRPLPDWLRQELRSDHAGETGAVAIYRGILLVCRDAAVRRFAQAHLATERSHLALIESVLPQKDRSVLLPFWRAAGFLTGALPALFGSRAVFATIEAVETFVDRHYAEQVARLAREGTHPELREMLERCRQDEVDHRDEAHQALDGPVGLVTQGWCRLVGSGSAAAVALARRA